ncbi:hypothetical protein QVD17_09341 [Tagetes erecta]|uniref:Uncharacterized protein n=1 Tax=Tagetes erecta TaxID=13708 RepID=A0AAD8L754_TARER|nr:hypothetical protein QVD17_09341 [Tagetes erecta]
MSSDNSNGDEAKRIFESLKSLNPDRVLRYFSFMYLGIGVEPFLLWLNGLEREIVFADDDANASGSGSTAPEENSVAPIVEDKKPVLGPGMSLTHVDFAKKRSV